MKLDDLSRFPHPVLWVVTGDFLDGSFSAGEVAVEEDLSNGRVTLNVEFAITHPDVRDLVDRGEACAGLIVECAETYLSRVCPLAGTGGTAVLEPGSVSGRVVVRPAVWSRQAQAAYRPIALHSEFSGQQFAMGKGALMAAAEEQIINVGREKLAPIETIFDLNLRADLPEHEFQVDLDSQRIKISVGRQAHEDISGMRNNRQGKSVLLSAVYLPVLMAVIEALKEGDPTHEGKRWYSVLTAKTTALGIDLKSSEPLLVAQKLLKAPFGRTAAAYREGQK